MNAELAAQYLETMQVFASVLSQRDLQPYETLCYRQLCDTMRAFSKVMEQSWQEKADENDDESGNPVPAEP